MHKKLTITIDEAVYEGLHQVVGRGRISRFIEDLIRPFAHTPLEVGYAQMADDEAREAEAIAWSEGTLGDVQNEPR